MTSCEIISLMEGSHSQPWTHRGAVQVGLLTFLFSVYIVLVIWMTGKCKMAEYRDFPNTKTLHTARQNSLFPANSTLSLNFPSQIEKNNSYHITDSKTTSNRIMLVHDYNASPHTQHVLSFKGCSYPCALTKDPFSADLLYLNAGQMSPRTVLPTRRKPDQIWLLSSREPPTFPRFAHLNRSDLRGQINWTRAIYSDATFPLTYGTLYKTNQVAKRDFDAIYESKKYSVAWFVGHCETQSRREEFVERMKSRIDIHVYGVCGNMTCGVRGYNMGGYKDVCLTMLSNNYKFYLAFENSFCENYVTEKFFNLFRGISPVDVIPVVRGGARYKRLFDPSIFVDAADFESPEDLADYLASLAGDKERYVNMLKQKSKYTAGRPSEKFECLMCRSLHLRDIPAQSYEDIHDFWTHPRRCHEPVDLGGG